jgi:hypothetical protein
MFATVALRFRTIFVVLAALSMSLPAVDGHASTAKTASASEGRVAVELTFLKSSPGERGNLVRFIERNWFEMDRIAVEQGLMRDYRLLETDDDSGAWNVLVEVTYTDARGYEGVREAFERIRSAHRTVAVDGRERLRDFGTIVESRKTYTRAAAPMADSAPN